MAETKTRNRSPRVGGPYVNRKAGDDRPVAKGSDLTVLTAIRQYKTEAKRAKWSRTLKNRANQRAAILEFDTSYKLRGQSKESLPKLSMAIEQFSAAIKRALTDFGDWFRCEVSPESPLTGEKIRALMMVYLGKLSDGYVTMPFAVLMSDAMKLAALKSLAILKVHGGHITDKRFTVERGLSALELGGTLFPKVTYDLSRQDVTVWRPWIDLVRDEDYFPDPRGHGLYEIQEIETDLGHLQEWAKAGVYDKAAVDRIDEDFQNIEQEIIKIRYVGQDIAPVPSFRKRVILHELWGTILGPRGRIVKKNCVATVANDKYVIRPPQDNPWWHGESPFVVFPLLRVPHSVWHKALADHGTALNIAMNELYNLMLDGGLASVWGIKQVRPDWLEDPRLISDGIPQGVTLPVNANCPPGGKAVEVVATGGVPQDALALFNISDREFNAGMMSNDLKFGQVSPRQVKATEVVASEQGTASMLDGIIRDIEDLGIGPLLRKTFLNLMQFADDLDSDDVVGAIGTTAAVVLSRMSPAQRFATFHGARFKVFGLSAVRARARDFSKLAALLQFTGSSPMMAQAFFQNYSPLAVLNHALKLLNVDPAALKMSDEERVALPQMLQQLPMFQQLINGMPQGQTQGGAGMSAQSIGDVAAPGELNMQRTNALSAQGQ